MSLIRGSVFDTISSRCVVCRSDERPSDANGVMSTLGGIGITVSRDSKPIRVGWYSRSQPPRTRQLLFTTVSSILQIYVGSPLRQHEQDYIFALLQVNVWMKWQTYRLSTAEEAAIQELLICTIGGWFQSDSRLSAYTLIYINNSNLLIFVAGSDETWK